MQIRAENVGPDLDPNYLTLGKFLKKLIFEIKLISRHQQKHAKC